MTTFDPNIAPLKPGEYERLLQKNLADLGRHDQLPALVPTRVSSFGEKVWLAMCAIKAERWEDLPGWSSWDHLRPWHEKRWPFDSDCPGIIKGNEEYRTGVLKLRKGDLNVLDYAWHAAHYEHRVRYKKTGSNPRWAGLILDAVAAHDLNVAAQLEMWLRDMHVTVERS